MFFLIAFASWIAGAAVSWLNGNRKLPITCLLIGLCLLFAPIGVWKLVGLALLAAILWIANKMDMA
jgi:hypothetical protein